MTPTETNILLAEFCGWTLNKGAEPHPAFPDDDPRRYWTSPTGEQKRLMGLPFTTDYNFFVECWNKAIIEFYPVFKNRKTRDVSGPLNIRIYKLAHIFTIEARLPILIEIIQFLNQQNP